MKPSVSPLRRIATWIILLAYVAGLIFLFTPCVTVGLILWGGATVVCAVMFLHTQYKGTMVRRSSEQLKEEMPEEPAEDEEAPVEEEVDA
ncbi:MAG: hypothetical protein MJ099_05895 [Clostridia bacterium]|nr:hypothetical protein [Clostridia bacterium]